ncbi:uncharacterized protein LOC142334511 [Convolutriloba macropyga]|uniref:uncharacterized protein LOC142334511 n=1 Tax=Convolutriloba macropyga TaxID=536237 RepID=UPI003F51FEAC
MESSLDSFFEKQRQERERELRSLNQTNLAVQLGCENYTLTQMLSSRIEQAKEEENDCCGSDNLPVINLDNSIDPAVTSELDRFFESQRAQRLNEVESLATRRVANIERRVVVNHMLQRAQLRQGTTSNTTTTSELESIENAQRVRTLLSDTFRNRLEEALRRPPPGSQNNRTSRRQNLGQNHNTGAENQRGAQSRNDVETRAEIPPPVAGHPAPPPVGWQSFREHVGEERVVRNERFDVFAEISGLISDQIVTQTLNSTIADLLESHLQHRMESAPSVYTWEAREGSVQMLNNLPRSQRRRNDFSDIGFVEVPTTTRRPRFVAQQQNRTRNQNNRNERQNGSRSMTGDDDRIDRLEQMIESLQSLLERQTTSQAQLENAVQQVILNQTLLSTNATGINISVQPETAGKCVVCLDDSRPVDSAFYKCGHVIACTPCAAVLLAVNPYCPLCRQKIDDVIKLYKLT